MASTPNMPKSLAPEVVGHLENIALNLQLVADMGYCDIALAVPRADGAVAIVADARPTTAIAPIASSRVGRTLRRDDEPEAYEALKSAAPQGGERRRVARGISYITSAYPVGGPTPYAVIIRDLAVNVMEAPGRMETEFMDAAEELLDVLEHSAFVDLRTGESFSTIRVAGDGVIRISHSGHIAYASPNAVNIMRFAGIQGTITGLAASALPGAAVAVEPVAQPGAALATDVEVGGRVLGYRTIGLPAGALVLVEDVTEARRREQEIKVKDATIREVHHRVKNNLQTIASLLRLQARRSETDEARRALAEATERVSSMAVVHELLSGSDDERVDFGEAASIVVAMVSEGLAGADAGIRVTVQGSTGEVDAHTATSLALALAELVHNAIEHGFAGREKGTIAVSMRRLDRELVLTVRDDGIGLPAGFDVDSSANLGLAIVRTVVRDDLRGTLSFTGGRGTTVTVRVPLADTDA
jgi:two-component system, sensor histidine kinase PdtaS